MRRLLDDRAAGPVPVGPPRHRRHLVPPRRGHQPHRAGPASSSRARAHRLRAAPVVADPGRAPRRGRSRAPTASAVARSGGRAASPRTARRPAAATCASAESRRGRGRTAARRRRPRPGRASSRAATSGDRRTPMRRRRRRPGRGRRPWRRRARRRRSPTRTVACRVATPPVPTKPMRQTADRCRISVRMCPQYLVSPGRKRAVPRHDDDRAGERRTVARPCRPPGYGGIENVLAALVPELRRRGVRVVLATRRLAARCPSTSTSSVFPDGQFARPAAALQPGHGRRRGAPAPRGARAAPPRRHRAGARPPGGVRARPCSPRSGRTAPPVLHTLHWDLRKHPELYGGVDGGGSLWVNGVSFAQLTTAPPALRALSVGHVHLATPLAVDADRRPAVPEGRAPGRAGPDHPRYKGQARRRPARAPHRAPSSCSPARSGRTTDPDDLAAGRRRGQPGRPLLARGGRAAGRRAAGALGRHGARARSATSWSPPRGASLFPIDWEEPGGTAVVESLALGTPVVGFRRGCLPELVEHGRTGLLVDPGDEDALAAAVAEAARLDPRRLPPRGRPPLHPGPDGRALPAASTTRCSRAAGGTARGARHR